MKFTRRDFLQLGATLGGMAAGTFTRPSALWAYAARKGVRFKIGAPDWNLRQENKLGSIALAKKIGFDGVQVSIGKGKEKLPLSDPTMQKAFLDESRRVGLPISSLCLEILHVNGLKNDPLGQRWVADAIPIAKALGVKVILLPFFGSREIKRREEQERVGDILREVAPLAEKAGVILGLEDTISARENVFIMERTKSPAVLTYYDVGNSTLQGYDILEEIRWLGRDRICEVHLKDNPHYLGEGKINFPAVIDALAEIGFDQWAQLECDSPSGSVENDLGRNLRFIRDLVARHNAAS